MRYELTLMFTGRTPASGDKPGRCVRCGCTDATQCPEGCHRVDDEHLLCSVCLDALLLAASSLGYRVGEVHDHRGELRTIAARVPKGT